MARRRSTELRSGLLLAVLLSVLLHVPLGIWFLNATWLRPAPPPGDSPLTVSLLRVTPPEDEEEPEPEDEDEPESDGQIVEIAPPEDPERPDEADFLAEYDSTVPEQTVDPRFRVDREVTAPTYSPEDAYDLEESQGIDVPAPSTGATAGREVFRQGSFSLFPDRQSQWDFSNREGLDAPAPVSHEQIAMAGSPSNDWLPEIDRGDRTALNSHETLYASWWNRVKQLVSFYADQTLDNARPSVALRSPRYEMELAGLIRPDGSITALEVKKSSGVREFDEAIREAFELAAPFPEPPEGAVEPDGFVHMDSFGFVITIGGARAELSGIDPRQNIQFPGLQTVPR